MHVEEPCYLKDAICYLIGPIDYAPDQGVVWRKHIVHACKDMGIKFLDPTNKVEGLTKEVKEEQIRMAEMRATGQWEELSVFMKTVVRHDHRSVDISDFVIMHVDKNVHMCGSYFELQGALHQKKPYYIHVEGGKKETPSWLFGIVDHNYIFGSLNEVINELCKIHTGEQPMNNRWVLIRKQIALL